MYEGSFNASLVLIHDVPDTKSTGKLEYWWRCLTPPLKRADFYITDLLPTKPESTIDRIPKEEMDGHIAALHDRLAKLTNPIVIVPTGNYALYALTGKGKVSWHRKDGKVERPGILDWRGSVLDYRGAFIVPTLHPAFVLRMPAYERRTLSDWARISGLVMHDCPDRGVAILPCRHCPDARPVDCRPTSVRKRIKPTAYEVIEYIDRARRLRAPVGLDIETPRGSVTAYQMEDGSWRTDVKRSELSGVKKLKSGKRKGEPKSKTIRGQSYIGCIGLSFTPEQSLTIPLTKSYWRSDEDFQAVRTALAGLLADDRVDKIVQNGVSFDLPRLRRAGYIIRGRVWDTRAMHHCIDPRDDHDLAYMASIYTYFPFWKHEAKDPDEATKYASNSEALWTYCGLDVLAMMEIWRVLKAELERRGLLEFYHAHYTRLVPALLDMTAHGIQVDDERRASLLQEYKAQRARLSEAITQEAGFPLVAKTGLSNERLKALIHGERGFPTEKAKKTYAKLVEKYTFEPMNLPPVYKRGASGQSVTLDEIALRKLILKHPALRGLGTQLLEFRRVSKLMEFCDPTSLDDDKRLRCSYSFVTEAGRLASSSNPWGTGRNLQNIDRQLRDMFVPDRGKDGHENS